MCEMYVYIKVIKNISRASGDFFFLLLALASIRFSYFMAILVRFYFFTCCLLDRQNASEREGGSVEWQVTREIRERGKMNNS